MKRKKNNLITVTVLLIVTLLSMNLFTNQTFAKERSAKIIFKEKTHDFGKVKEGVELTYEFKFNNEGDENLVIQRVQASCGCTGASIGDKIEFKKNEAGEISVSFNTEGRSGLQNKTVMVQSNDPESPEVILSFTCEIVSK